MTLFNDVRRPVVAGQFYPGSAEALRTMVDGLLADEARTGPQPIALISPHAGYVYSGHVAAAAFKQAEGVDYDAVVILSAHTDAWNQDVMIVWPQGAFSTPLGDVTVDAELAQALIDADEHIKPGHNPHLGDHSIEVQLPFLQRVQPGLAFVPVAVCDRSYACCQALANALVKVLGGRKALLVASTDLSHYPSYEDARQVDHATVEAVCSLDPHALESTVREKMSLGLRGLETCICGEGGVKTAMLYAQAVGAQADVIKCANSGDVEGGDRWRVVGYAAVRFSV
jgi:AmmeMemoRadiSam system protein B